MSDVNWSSITKEDVESLPCVKELQAQAVQEFSWDLLKSVAVKFDGNDDTDWSIGANHVFKLFAKEAHRMIVSRNGR